MTARHPNAPLEVVLPPSSVEAEQSVIGALLLDNCAWIRIAELVSVEDFSQDDHRRILRHILELIGQGYAADVVTVCESISRSNETDQTGGMAYLGEIANATPSAANIASYAKVVREHSKQRELLAITAQIQALALRTASIPADLLARLQQVSVPDKQRISVVPLDITACLTTEPAPLDFVLPGFLAGTVGGLVSPGGTGKSIFALEVALSIALDVAAGDILHLGIERHGEVTILAGEDPGVALHHRLRAIARHMPSDAVESVAGQLRIVPTVGYDIDIMRPDSYRWIQDLAAGQRLLIIDTLSRFHRLDENDTADAKAVMTRMEVLARETGATILFLHHVSKAAALGGMGDLQQAARGSSVFVDNARWLSFVATMTPLEAEQFEVAEEKRRHFVRWNISKENYAEPISDRWYHREEGGVLVPTEMRKPTGIASKAVAERRARREQV